MPRRERAQIKEVAERLRLRRRVHGSTPTACFDVLTGPKLLDPADAHLPAHRERLYRRAPTVPAHLTLAISVTTLLSRSSVALYGV